MPPRSHPSSPWPTVAGVLLAIGLPSLPLHAAGGKTDGSAAIVDEAVSATSDDRLTVSALNGRAFHIRGGGVYSALDAGASVEVNRPVKVGPKSRMDLRWKDGGTLELGPGAQVVLFPETRDGRDATSVTALRLDEGYLRVIIQGQTAHNRFEVSSARWQAQLQNGEYVFDSQGAESSVCTLSGAMRLSGLPDGVDMPQARGCVHLSGQAVQVVTLTSADWALVEKRRSLLPALAQVGDRPRDAAVASRDESGSLLKMPKTRFVPARVPPPVSLARVDAMIERLDRWIAQQQALLADELIASTPTTLGLSQTLASAPPPVPPLSPDVPADAESRGEWIINIDTYPSQETAELQAAKLRAQDIQASIRSETVRGRSSYRVVVEGLASEGDANAVRDRLVSTLGMRQAWVFRKH